MAVAELFAKGDMAGARAKLHHDMQHYINEVTGERLQEILGHITALARRATQAGADAIEVHGDRLVGSLCSPLINQRTDEYGGSFENRTRFARAVVRAIREGSPDICIDYKLPIITEDPQLGRGGHRNAEPTRPGRTPGRPRAGTRGRRAGTGDPGDQHPLRLRGHRLRHGACGLRHRRA